MVETDLMDQEQLMDKEQLINNMYLDKDPLRFLCICGVQKYRQMYLIRRTWNVGPHWGGVVITYMIIIGSTLMFIKNECTCVSSVLLSIAQCVLVCLFLFLTAFTDPGIVKAKQDGTHENGKFCTVCQIVQLDTTEHCEDCDCCILGYDHHCPWMGKCIGQGNMKWFVLFNVSWVIYLMYVLLTTFGNMSQRMIHQKLRGSNHLQAS